MPCLFKIRNNKCDIMIECTKTSAVENFWMPEWVKIIVNFEKKARSLCSGPVGSMLPSLVMYIRLEIPRLESDNFLKSNSLPDNKFHWYRSKMVLCGWLVRQPIKISFSFSTRTVLAQWFYRSQYFRNYFSKVSILCASHDQVMEKTPVDCTLCDITIWPP